MSSLSTRQGDVARLGASFCHFVNTAIGIYTLVAPVANTKGIILRTIAAASLSPGNGTGIYADTVAPAALGDTSKRALWDGESSSYPFFFGELFIPAGLGFYAVFNSTNNRLQMTWDVLP